VLLNFSFQFSPLFLNISLTKPYQSHIYGSGAAPALSDNIEQWTFPKIWVSPFLVRSVDLHLRAKTEVILTVEMETRHPVGGLFGREFSAFVIIAEL